ncbi:shikimate dehydrogenase [Cognatishimia activa]|uniref:Quinate/shikimate dehydrogenase n=1 Tax=Cognatishimia activa TaxID=1715691 RepID=A0A0P1IMA0_9RHOB|nr:shikimate dehydrogenase [Cognatishimia activa]CUI37448.1 Quinate/shikimate dehydrogenase [Cognatishimia activa]CUK24769.1 Quinate/shikimate dehydrogenase [Cognatishimia activa]
MKAALIGYGIAKSLTPEMHLAEAQAQGFVYDYQRFDTATAEFNSMTLPQILDKAQSGGLAGVNVTYPFKRAATEQMDELSDTARLLGAVNTVLFKDGQRIGHNTDYVGFRSALRGAPAMTLIQNVSLVGAGGAGGAVALALIDQGCENLFIFDQRPSAAQELAERIRCARPRAMVRRIEALSQSELVGMNGVVNATPMGMASQPGMAVDPAMLNPACWVADIVYFPRQTALLQAAQARRLRTLDGSGMAVFQAAAAFHLITGRVALARRMFNSFDWLVPQEEVPA